MVQPRVTRQASLLITSLITAAFALVIGGGGLAKLAGDPAMISLFERIGSGEGLRYLTGALELAGGLALLVPRLRVLGGVCLAALLGCAGAVNVVVLHESPVLPLLLAAISSAIAVGHLRRNRPRSDQAREVSGREHPRSGRAELTRRAKPRPGRRPRV